MSKKKVSCVQLARISRAVELVVDSVTGRLDHAGVRSRVVVSQSKRTGSAYVRFRVLDPLGKRLKGCGACVRVSNHRKPSERGADFSRPASRYYGVWCYTEPARIERKAERIVGGIVKRYDALSSLFGNGESGIGNRGEGGRSRVPLCSAPSPKPQPVAEGGEA